MGGEFRVSVAARFENGAGAIAYLAPILPSDGSEERLIVVFMDENGRVLDHLSCQGDEQGVNIPIRRILVRAILRDARGVLIAHNHPSGDPTPSAVDVEETRKLAAGLGPLGITLHDHLIRAGDEWRSMAALNLM